MTEERREVTVDELARLQRAGNIDMSLVKVDGVCTIFREDSSVKGQMEICTVEEAEALEAAQRT